MTTNNFTQLVWRSTELVGFGISQAANGSYFCVALYHPCGNKAGKFIDNVLRPIEDWF